MDLTGRRYLVTGVLNEDSIAWHVAAGLQRAGAEILLTSFGRPARITKRALTSLPADTETIELDVGNDDDFPMLAAAIEARWSTLDGVVHAIASGSADSLNGGFLTTPASSALAAFRISVYSLQQLASTLEPLLARAAGGGSVVALTVDTTRAIPGYDWMGVCKGALWSVAQYLSIYLGRSRIRVNLVASGPIETLSSGGIESFGALADHYERWAPLGWDRADPSGVVGAVLFLLSDLASSVTAQVIYADGGLHASLGGVEWPAPGL